MASNREVLAYVALPMVHKRDFSSNEKYVKLIEGLGLKVISKWVTSMDTATPPEVFQRDVKSIERSDIIIADVTEPSHGVGMELMYAFLKGKKIIVTAKEGSKVSYMILGMPRVKIVWYNSLDDLEIKLRKVLGELRVVP